MEEIIKYLGNFHPVILHLPIGAFLFTLLLFIYQKFSKIDLTIPVRLGLIFSFVSAIISSLSALAMVMLLRAAAFTAQSRWAAL